MFRLTLADEDTLFNLDAKYAEYAEYAKYAKYANYVEHATHVKYAEYADWLEHSTPGSVVPLAIIYQSLEPLCDCGIHIKT